MKYIGVLLFSILAAALIGAGIPLHLPQKFKDFVEVFSFASPDDPIAPTETQTMQRRYLKNDDAVLEAGGAKLEIPAGALKEDQTISLTVLNPGELPPLDQDLVNVTPGEGGFRCLPHGTTFLRDVRFTVPYDSCLIPPGYTAQHIRTFFYDEQAARWVSLPYDTLLATRGALASMTTHFTDFINGIIKTPDAPETQAYTPTSIKDLKAADPSANIEAMAPPAANNMGTANLQLPIKLPSGRKGMQPLLNIRYNSEGGNGWLGLGWDLSLPAIAIETRWGVPRYDPDLETETYLLGGAQLAPVTHRADWEPRSPGDKTFHPRVEGSFQKIVRHGNSPKDYWWEVTQKDGTKSIYGGNNNSVLKDEDGNIAQWMLRETRDLNQNFVTYSYVTQADVGISGGIVEGRQIYISEITYTGHGTEEGKYRVEFLRDRQLPGEPRRPDVQISGRLGFKQVTADLLRKINITYDGQPIRSYELLYETGAFYKTLLSLIIEYDQAGNKFAQHGFEYFDEVREADGKYQPFQLGDSTWNAGNDDVKSEFLGFIEDDISALGGSESSNFGFGLIVTLGIGFDPGTKSFSVGGGGSYGRGSSTGRIAMVDVDGDRLPDKVFKIGSELYFRKNLSGATIGLNAFGPRQMIATVSDFSRSKSRTINWNIEANASVSYGPISAGAYYSKSWTNTKTTTDVYLLDYNSDGLIDVASRGKVLFNHLVNGVPTFDDDSNLTPNPIVPGAALDTALVNFNPAEQDTLINQFPLSDVVRVWRPPFNGRVKLDAPVRLTNLPAAADYDLKDGVRVAIQFNGNVLDSMLIDTADFSEKILVSPDQEFVVDTLDHFYFRVQSRFDGAFDRVIWQPKFTYTEIENLTNAGIEREANGQNVFEYQSAQDFVVTGFQSTNMPYKGTIKVSGNFKKPKTTDDVELQMVRLIDNQPSQVLFSKKYLSSDTVNENIEFFQDVEFKDPLSFGIKTHTNVDWTSVKWMPNLQLIDAVDPSGMPVPGIINPATGISYYNFCPSVNFSMFNHAFKKTPVWVADADAILEVTPKTQNTPSIIWPSLHGVDSITLSVKKPGILLGKTTFMVKGDSIVSAIPLHVPVKVGDSIYVEYHIPNRNLADSLIKWGQLEISAFLPGGNAPNTAGVFSTLSEAEFIFGALHRGWGGFAYNGNRDRATEPINEDELNLDEAKSNKMDQTQIEGIDNPDKLDGAYDPSRANFTMLFPDAKVGAWRSSDEFVYLRGDTLSSSRLGEDDILLLPPTVGAASQFYAPSQVSISKIKSWNGGFTVTLPIPLNKSSSDNVTNSEIQVFDGDGDGNVDFYNKGKAQFSHPLGGLMPNVHQIGFENMTSLAHSDGGTKGGSPVIAAVNTAIAAYGVGSAKKKEQAIAAISGFSMNAVNVTIPNIANVNFNASYNENFDYTKYSWLDVNGDGLPDWVKNDGMVALSLGRSFAPFEQWQHDFVRAGKSTDEGLGGGVSWGNLSWAFGVSRSETKTDVEKALQDVNGDGLLDMVFLADPITVRLNTGCGFAPFYTPWHGVNFIEKSSSIGTSLNGAFTYCFIIPIPFAPLKICINPSGNYGGGASRQLAQMVDINGDGFPDLASSNDANDLRVRLSTIGKTNMLKTVYRPMGASFSMDYKRMGNTYEMAQSKWVLSKVEIFDGLNGDGPTRTANRFEYADGYYDRRERDFYGFATVISTQLNTADNDAPYRVVTQEYNNQNYYEKGLLLREVMIDAAGNRYTETLNTYEVRDITTGIPLASPTTNVMDPGFPALLKTEKRFYEGQQTAGLSTETHWKYDLAGNIIQYTETGDGTPQDSLQAVIAYHTLPSVGLSSIPNSIRVQAGDQKDIRRREADIDSQANVVQIRQYLDSNTFANFDMEYDVYGNLSKITRPPNDSMQRLWFAYDYDPVVHTYVVKTTDTFGLSSTAVYDYLYGQLLGSTDANGQQMKYTIDAQGRINTITGPYEKDYTIAFDYHPDAAVPYAKTRHYDPETGQDIETYTFMDGLMRPVQVKKTGAIFSGDGATDNVVYIVSGQTKYDAFGRTVEEGQPTIEPLGNPSNLNTDPAVRPTSTEYDILDRPVLVTLPDDSQQKTVYDFGSDSSGYKAFLTKATDPMGFVQETYTDLRERKRATRVFDPGAIWTGYRYNAVSELLAVITHNNDSTQYTYDRLGRMTRVVHPDFGENRMTYDLAGNMTTKSTPNLRDSIADTAVIRYSYSFGRLARIDYPDNYQNQVEYRYGEPGAKHNRAGRVWLQIDATGGQEFFYGPLGEIVKTIRTIVVNPANQQTYVWEAQYDTWNRIQTQTYPDGELVDYAYNRAGKVTNVTGTKDGIAYTYLTQLGYDEFEQRVFSRLGNGTTTAYTYDPARRWLTGLRTDLPSGRRIMALAYAYDAVGNVLSMTNSTLPMTGPAQMGGPTAFEYGYDPLYRLTSANGNWTGANNKSASFTLDMTYDNRHNILQKTQAYTEDGTLKDKSPLTHDNRYAYGTARPHAPDTVGLRRYTYDANGNTTGWSDKNTWRKMLWDEENRLTAVSVEGFVYQYTYDHKGERTIKSSGGSQGVFANGAPMQFINHNSDYTAYVSPELVVRDHAFTKHYYIEGQRIATKIGAGRFVNRTVLNPFLTAGGLNYIKRTELLRTAGKRRHGQIPEPPGPPIPQGLNHSPANTGIPHPIYIVPDSVIMAIPPGWSFNPPTPMPGVPSTPIPVVASTAVTNDSVRAGYGYVPPTDSADENSRYFYHADHLGSSSYITDRAGFVTQHLAYMPFGEAFVDEYRVSKDAYRSPYRFTGKELDEGTDLYYFGARYYDPNSCIWLSVDPMTEKYPGWSGYNYVMWNPVKLVDPDGREPSVEEAAYMQQYQYDGKGKLLGGWKPVVNKDERLYNNKETGFSAGLFERTSDGKTEYALVFSGTDDKKDLGENARQLQGASYQYLQAQLLANVVSEQKSGSELTMVGHSLGGGLATVASKTTGRTAITFNPETVSKMTESNLGISGRNSKISAYIFNGDILNKVHPNPQGQQFSVMPRNPSSEPKNSIEAHRIGSFINAIETGGLIINRKK